MSAAAIVAAAKTAIRARFIHPPFVTRGLLGPISDISAGRTGPLAIVPRAARLGAGAAGHAFGHVARTRMVRAVVPRTTFHRLDIFTALGRGPMRGVIVQRVVGRTNIAEYT